MKKLIMCLLVPLVVSLSVCPVYGGGFSKAGGLAGGFLKQELLIKRKALIQQEVERLKPLVDEAYIDRKEAYDYAKQRATAIQGVTWNKVVGGTVAGLVVFSIGWEVYNRVRGHEADFKKENGTYTGSYKQQGVIMRWMKAKGLADK